MILNRLFGVGLFLLITRQTLAVKNFAKQMEKIGVPYEYSYMVDTSNPKKESEESINQRDTKQTTKPSTSPVEIRLHLLSDPTPPKTENEIFGYDEKMFEKYQEKLINGTRHSMKFKVFGKLAPDTAKETPDQVTAKPGTDDVNLRPDTPERDTSETSISTQDSKIDSLLEVFPVNGRLPKPRPGKKIVGYHWWWHTRFFEVPLSYASKSY